MTIFFANEWLQNEITRRVEKSKLRDALKLIEARELFPSAGYERDIEMFKEVVQHAGWELTDQPEGDLEVYIGPPFQKCRPHFKPAAIFTMAEHEWQVTSEWVEAINSYSLCITPSRWCVELFKRCGVKIPIRYAPHWLDFRTFRFLERDFEGPFTIISQATRLFDRKGAWWTLQWFWRFQHKLPEEVNLIVKTSSSEAELDLALSRTRFVATTLEPEEYTRLLSLPLLSVYPSSGEGFGLIPAEHAAVGMAVAVSPVSGLKTELVDRCDAFLPLSGAERVVSFLGPFPRFVPDEVQFYNLVMTLYENRVLMEELAVSVARFVHEEFTFEKRAPKLIDALLETAAMRREKLETPARLTDFYLGEFKVAEEKVAEQWGIPL